MKITTLVENSTCRQDLTCEHGLSLYIETDAYKILFDAGQTDHFADNAAKLGVDLSAVDFAVLSHGHYDHGGGLARFLELNAHAPVYLHRDAFGAHFNGTEKYIGLAPQLRESPRLVFTDDVHSIVPGVTLHSCNRRSRPYTVEPFGLNVREGNRFRPEEFLHEQYLLIEEHGKRILISGCSHKGILNIVHWFGPDVLVGGFHFMKLDPDGPGRPILSDAADLLLRSSATFYTGHCTGERQFAYLKSLMGDRLHALSTGSTMEL